MLNRVKSKSEYFRNIITLMMGTSIAQAIPIALSPILTRIYSPEDFGLFALYMALLSIFSIISTCRYELAILLPRNDEDAFQIAVIASAITVVVSSLLLLLVTVYNLEISRLLKNEEISPWLYLLPISVLITGQYQIFNYWHNRQKRYLTITSNRVLQSGFTGLGQLTFSQFINAKGLIFGHLFGQLLALLFFLKVYVVKDNKRYRYNLLKMRVLARSYKKFPIVDVPTASINIIANQTPNILLATLFSASTAGFYYLTQRVLQAPISLISGSVLDVFKQKASEDYKENGQCREIYNKTFLALFFMALPPSVILFYWVEDLFTLVFGDSWSESGVYAKILIPALFFRFVSNPLGFMIYIAEKHIWNFLTMIWLLTGILVALFTSNSSLEAVKWITFVYCIYYCLHLLISARLAKSI